MEGDYVSNGSGLRFSPIKSMECEMLGASEIQYIGVSAGITQPL